MDRLKVRRVHESDAIIKSWRVIPYPELIQVLKEDGMAFVEDINRKTAWGASRRLTALMKNPVTAEVAFFQFKGSNDKAKGYLFKVTIGMPSDSV